MVEVLPMSIYFKVLLGFYHSVETAYLSKVYSRQNELLYHHYLSLQTPIGASNKTLVLLESPIRYDKTLSSELLLTI